MADTKKSSSTPYATLQTDFITEARSAFKATETEVSERNSTIVERDEFIYGDRLDRALKVPIGHDATPVNWLRRTVEIHKNMFMSRGFHVLSTYDSTDASTETDPQEESRIEIENQKQKDYAERRMKLVEAIKRDNGGDALWSALAENASAVGMSALKMYYDEDESKIELCEVESVENLYAIWSRDNFRSIQAYAYVYQVAKEEAIREYGAPQDVATSTLGKPFDSISASGTSTPPGQVFSQPMVTILEITGVIGGWGTKDGKVVRVTKGKENELNVLIVGNKITRLITETKKMPKYYIFPNKRQRRRPWGTSDISDAAININLTYIETLSDWRTLASKVNFQKFKALGFPQDATIPKPEPRKVEFIPLGEDQDIVPIQSGDANSIDWQRQLDECKEQFVRETGISRVLFDDPSVTLNSNQALLTSMKPTSDIAEAKKQLWSPILTDLFTDALELVAQYNPDLKEIVDPEDDWSLKIMWPSVMQKEDPVYQSMILNRFNAGTMSLQSYLEAQGESKEEIDRLRDEMNDPITAAILGKNLPMLSQVVIDTAMAEVKATVMAAYPELFQQEQQGAPAGQPEGINPNGGGAAQIGAGNEAMGGIGAQPVSQPGTGATAASPEGALGQVTQNMGG